MSVANQVLALHEGIIEALILEEHSGEHSIVDRATRDSAHPTVIGGKEDQLMLPALILGVATQFRMGRFPPKMVAIPYGDVGVLFCQLTGKRVMVVTAYSDSLTKVMELTDGYTHKFDEKESHANLIKSVAEAEQAVRRYLEGRREYGAANTSVDDVAYREVDNRWVVSGAGLDFWSRGRRYLVELDAQTGLVMRFNSTFPAENRLPPRPTAATPTTYCRHCGAVIGVSDGFCYRCGWPTRFPDGPGGRGGWRPWNYAWVRP